MEEAAKRPGEFYSENNKKVLSHAKSLKHHEFTFLKYFLQVKSSHMCYYSYIPLKTRSEANSTEHWAVKRKRRMNQKNVVKMTLLTTNVNIKFPAIITLTRIAPRKMDFDNLVSSFKYIRDAISEHAKPGLAKGQADANENDMTFHYKQVKGEPKQYAISISICEDSRPLSEMMDLLVP